MSPFYNENVGINVIFFINASSRRQGSLIGIVCLCCRILLNVTQRHLTDIYCIFRWDEYSPYGEQIPGTPFIGFKVPLKEVRQFIYFYCN